MQACVHMRAAFLFQIAEFSATSFRATEISVVEEWSRLICSALYKFTQHYKNGRMEGERERERKGFLFSSLFSSHRIIREKFARCEIIMLRNIGIAFMTRRDFRDLFA